jgi:hypothetical protein
MTRDTTLWIQNRSARILASGCGGTGGGGLLAPAVAARRDLGHFPTRRTLLWTRCPDYACSVRTQTTARSACDGAQGLFGLTAALA